MSTHITSEIRARKSNQLVTSKYYATILKEYNEILRDYGKVNDKKFWTQNILPRIPEYKLMSWYQFLRRFKTATALVAAAITDQYSKNPPNKNIEEAKLEENLITNEAATNIGIQRALNIGADAFDQLINHPEELSAKERTELFFKAMKAQDSRINAVRNVRQDNREEAKFHRAFNNASYGKTD